MAQETFVVLVDFIVDERLLTGELRRHGLLETVDDAFENGLVEHQRLALHDGAYVVARQQFAALEDDAVSTCIEHVDPQFLVEYFTREDEHLDLRIHLLGLTAYLDADSRGAAQSEVEQDKVGLLFLDESPERQLVVGSTDDFCLGDFVTNDTFRTFEFEGHVLDDNKFKLVHCCMLVE